MMNGRTDDLLWGFRTQSRNYTSWRWTAGGSWEQSYHLAKSTNHTKQETYIFQQKTLKSIYIQKLFPVFSEFKTIYLFKDFPPF